MNSAGADMLKNTDIVQERNQALLLNTMVQIGGGGELINPSLGF